jgi:hypothetical protein
MPLAKGSSKKAVKARFHEFRHGKTYAKTARKFGKATARKQLIAVGLGDRNGKKKSSRKREGKTKGQSQASKRKGKSDDAKRKEKR